MPPALCFLWFVLAAWVNQDPQKFGEPIFIELICSYFYRVEGTLILPSGVDPIFMEFSWTYLLIITEGCDVLYILHYIM